MSTNIKTWYDFVLQQMAAESYLAQVGENGLSRKDILMLGSNRPGYLQNGSVPQSTDKVLSGATRMTATQADYFLQNFTVVDHRGNDDPRFAALGANASGVNVQIGNGRIKGVSFALFMEQPCHAAQRVLRIRQASPKRNQTLDFEEMKKASLPACLF